MSKIILLICISVWLCLPQVHSQHPAVETSGDVLQIVLPATAFASTFYYKDGTKGTLQFIGTMSVAMVLTHSLKRIIDKPRPNGGSLAFPSGHTSSAFTGAAFLQRRYGWHIGLPAYILAAYTGWTRVYANKHDYYDVLGGAIIGIGSAYLFTKPYDANIELSVGKQNEVYMLSMRWQF